MSNERPQVSARPLQLRVHGAGRVADNEGSIVVYFNRRLTDDELRFYCVACQQLAPLANWRPRAQTQTEAQGAADGPISASSAAQDVPASSAASALEVRLDRAVEWLREVARETEWVGVGFAPTEMALRAGVLLAEITDSNGEKI